MLSWRRATVGSNEWLARFILRKEHIRSDGTIKPDPFIPYKYVELSVTRHIGLSENEIWDAGKIVAAQIEKPLLGRADAKTKLFQKNNLSVKAAPVKGNRNHGNVIGWPTDKQSQKEIALLLLKDGEVSFSPLPDQH